jgi:hypothetical protein
MRRLALFLDGTTDTEAGNTNVWRRSFGVPWDVAFSLDWSELYAFNIVFGELRTGKKFNWDSLNYRTLGADQTTDCCPGTRSPRLARQ